MNSMLTNLEDIRPRYDFLNLGITSTINIRKGLSVDSKVSIVKCGVVREEPSESLFLENFYLEKQVIRYIQVPVMLNIDRFKYNERSDFYSYGYLQVGFYYNFLIDATLKYEAYWDWLGWTRPRIRNTEYFRNDFGVAMGLGIAGVEKVLGMGIGVLAGASLLPVTNPLYTSEKHRILFLQIYIRTLFYNKIK